MDNATGDALGGLHLVYHREYNLGPPFLPSPHSFDGRKYAKAWKILRKRLGQKRLGALLASPLGEATREQLARVHDEAYLESLREPARLARILELPVIARTPAWLTRRYVLRPMAWATAGTVLAMQRCLDRGLAFHLGGGYHHAKPAAGEGFCVYADIALGIDDLRRTGALASDATIAYIDLDAHQGNGVCWCFREDRSVQIFDMYNGAIYPLGDEIARARIDGNYPLLPGTTDSTYLGTLRSELPPFLDALGSVGLAIYNAGTDVISGDALGGMGLTADGVLERDLFVTRELRGRGIPTTILTSGGYTAASASLIAATIEALVDPENSARRESSGLWPS